MSTFKPSFTNLPFDAIVGAKLSDTLKSMGIGLPWSLWTANGTNYVQLGPGPEGEMDSAALAIKDLIDTLQKTADVKGNGGEVAAGSQEAPEPNRLDPFRRVLRQNLDGSWPNKKQLEDWTVH